MKYIMIPIFAIILFTAVSCSNSDSPSSNPSPNSMTATITGNENLTFTAQAVNFDDQVPPKTIRLSGTFIKSAIQTYTLNMTVPDSVTGVLNFDLKGTDPLTGLTVNFASGINDYYTFNVSGSLKFDYRTADSVSGTFTLYAAIADSVTSLKKFIQINDGKFFYSKKNGAIQG